MSDVYPSAFDSRSTAGAGTGARKLESTMTSRYRRGGVCSQWLSEYECAFAVWIALPTPLAPPAASCSSGKKARAAIRTVAEGR